MQNQIFCSVIIPTIGRSTLERAIQSILQQDFTQADFEIIVVNDSGQLLPEASWQHEHRVKIIHTNRRERSFARNSGAAIARGNYLVFLDDDDWFLPGALNNFHQLANQHPQAVWLYGGIHVIDEAGTCLAELNSGWEGNCFAQIMGGAWAPIQSSLMQTATFFQLGGFNPAICGTEDEDLCRRYAGCGEFANTPAALACLFRGRSWDTSTNYLRAPADTRLSRDLLLAEKGSFQRLMASARSSYWKGRICHSYLSTASWNLKRKRFFSALSRGLFGLATMIRSGKDVFRKDFWDGIQDHHVPGTLHYVMQSYEQKIRKGSLERTTTDIKGDKC